MKCVWTFPGQGSQSLGMGKELAENFSGARAVFEEVDEALNQKLSDVIWGNDLELLTSTANAQPALMAVSLAAVAALAEQGVTISKHASYVAGHSLGEYSALAAAGCLSVSNTARLLRIRGDAMQKAVPTGQGGMAAILGLEAADVIDVCNEAGSIGVCEIANDNAPGQIVISGTREAVEKAAELAKAKGARRALMLPVSAPFHCSLMQSAADEMAQALADVDFGELKVPVISNVLAKPETDSANLKDHLIQQVTGKVRWAESISWLNQNGSTHQLELGSGKVLQGLTKRIAPEMSVVSINSPKDIASLSWEF